MQVLHRAAGEERANATCDLAAALHYRQQVTFVSLPYCNHKIGFIFRGHAIVPVINDALQEWVDQFRVRFLSDVQRMRWVIEAMIVVIPGAEVRELYPQRTELSL